MALAVFLVVSLQRPESERVRTALNDANRSYAGEKWTKAESEFADIVREHGKSRDPVVQDQVATARIRMGYSAGRRLDFARAREHFREAEANYRGTGAAGPDFGGYPDQAAYQAAVCLIAQGKKQEAKEELLAFMMRYENSPLVHAAHRRLCIIDAERREVYDGLLQAAIDRRAERMAFERVSCGPKALSHLLGLMRREDPGYEKLAELCGTGKEGTSLLGMRDGLKACGVQTHAYELNRQDFMRISPPAIWLLGDHYLVVEDFGPSSVKVFDPTIGRVEARPIPQSDTFVAAVLLITPLNLRGNQP